ncbi:MAG: tandem-95 repeat protein, partial [Candidatus Promineifilaceae bacterium]|nr:tandem-95 repeat protein [Candidatus Promineifilaceae bacterium]
MLSIKSYRSLLAITLIFVGFVALFSLEASPVRTAQAPTDYIRHVRNFDADNIGALNPVGLTFSPISANFLVLEANASPSNSNIISVSPLEIRYDSVPIEAAVADPINMTFDSKVGRLLILDSESDELIEIEAASDGSLLPNTLTRHDVQHFGIQNPQGMTIDPLSGHLFVVDEPGPRLIQIEPDSGQGFDNAVISVVGLESTGLEDVRGLAFDPTSTNLHIYSAGDQEITEIDQSGQVLLSRDLSQFEFGSLQAMVFAPSGDSTDDPSHLNLYVADSGSTPVGSEQLATADYESAVSGADYQIFAPVAVAFSGGGGDNRHRAGTIIEFSLTEPISVRTKYASSSVQATLVQTINTYQWSPPSPDSAGIVYLPDSDSLLISDSEVNEMTIFTGVNMFGATLTGGLFDTWSTLAFSNEPTGVTLNTTNGHLFISDDTGTRAVYELNPGPDGLYDTADDTSSYFVTSNFGSSDPEGVTYASSLGVLFVVDGVNSEVYRVAPGSNGLFDGVPPGGDDQVTSFDTMALGLHDPEGIAYNSDTGSLYIAGDMGGYDTLLEVTNTGIFLQTIDVSAANAKYLSGLAFAPSSDNPNARSIYIADRGRDNDQDPNENDGKVYEMALPISGPVAPVANDDNASTIVGTAVTIDVAANDTDVNNNLDPNSANSVCANCTEPTGGLLTDNGDGTITYTPIGDYSGADTFVYEICDTDPLCSTGTVYVSVAPNLPPQANNDTANTTAGLQITIDVAGNDSDPNGNLDPSTTNTDCATCTTPPNGVLFNHGDGTFDYTSNTNFSGIDNFVYQICDTNGACATATVTITVSETPDSLYISTVSDVNIGGVTYADEDILVFDTTTETWSMHFDGSDVGLNAGGQEIDALHINTDGSILLSLGKSGNIAGFGAVDDFDILRFIPTSTGVDTAGTYEMYLDGEDVGLTGEDIDALGFTTDGRIVVSFRGSFTIDGISGNDEDLLAFTASSLGPTTSGSWEFYFDGSDIALDNASTEDTNGIWIDDLGDIQLTVRGAFEVPGVAGDGADIFVCEPLSLGSVTDCNFRMFWDGSTYGLNGEISGIFMNSQQPNDPPQANDDNPGTDEDTLVVINVAGNDSDPDGNLAPNSANTACATCTLPADGSLANNGDGTFDYNP